MIKIILSFLIGMVVFTGCTGVEPPKPIYDDFKNIGGKAQTKTKTTNEVSTNYKVGILKKCNVGNEIIYTKNYNKLVTEKFDEAIKFKALINSSYTQVGKIYSISGISLSNNSNYFIFLFEDNHGMYKYLKINSDGYVVSNHLFGSFGQVVTNDYFSLSGQKIFEHSTATEVDELILKGSFGRELIYSGKDGNNIKVSYREYKDDMARPAFFQNLTYNLKESDIIRYKNYKIKVHKATNEEISYTVLED